MLGRLVFFIGAYDTLDLFTEELCQVFQNMGYECFVYDIRMEESSKAELAVFLMDKVDAAIGYNNMGFDLELVEGRIIWDDLGILFINILMDHPFHYHRTMQRAPLRSIVLSPDRNHVNYIRRFYPNIGWAGFMPHGGVEYAGNIPYPRIKDRNIEVLYAGGLSRGVAECLIPDLDKFTEFNAVDLMKNVLENLFSHPSMTTEQSIEEYLIEKKIAIPDEKLCEYISDLRFIDSYATSYFRENAVRVLVENGICVHVYGNGWECCDWIDNKNFIFDGVIPAREIINVMRESKIVLNTMTWFKDGTHDRVFNAMLAGSVALTDTSIYMKQEFEDGKGLKMFELLEEWNLPQVVKELLTNEDEMQKIADEGYSIAKNKCTFQTQAKYIKELFDKTL